MGKKTKKFADDGWGLWIYGDSQSTLYLNEWVNPQGKSYVDISTRIYSARNVTYVNYFIPFHVEESELTDLSYMLADIPVLQAMFNTNGKVDTEKNEYTSELSYDDRRVSLINISPNFLCVKQMEHGAVVTFDFGFIKDYITADEAYIIFRVPHKTLDEVFASRKDVSNSFSKLVDLIQSPVVSEKYGYAVRINEARRLPQQLNEIEVLQQQRIKKALITITISDDYEINDSACYRIRRFEEDLMRSYVPEGFPYEDAITYQWVDEKDKTKKSHYNFYFTVARSLVSNMSMLVYFILVFVLGIFGSAIYDVIKFFVMGGK